MSDPLRVKPSAAPAPVTRPVVTQSTGTKPQAEIRPANDHGINVTVVRTNLQRRQSDQRILDTLDRISVEGSKFAGPSSTFWTYLSSHSAQADVAVHQMN